MSYQESTNNARKGFLLLPFGGGNRLIKLLITCSTPFPVLAETETVLVVSIPIISSICFLFFLVQQKVNLFYLGQV